MRASGATLRREPARVVTSRSRRAADVSANATLRRRAARSSIATPAGRARGRRSRVPRAAQWRATRSPPPRPRSRSAIRSTPSRAASRRFAPCRAARRLRARSGGRVRHRRHLQRQSRFRCAPRSTCSRRRRRRGCLVLGDMGELGAQGPAFHREIGAYARERGIDAPVRGRRRSRAKPSRRSAPAPCISTPRTRSRALRAATRSRATTVLVKGSRFMRMERVVAALAAAAGRSTALMLLCALPSARARYVRAFNVFSYITLRAVLATMTALVISFVIGPRMIAWLSRMKIGQAVRDDGPQTHLVKAGTPTMGGALILVVDRDHHAAVGQPRQPLRLGRAARDARLRRGRLGRRLAQGGAPQSEGPVGAREAPLAIADRARRGGLSRVLDSAPDNARSSSCS